MPIPLTIPRLGWSMEEGTFGAWLKSDGEPVHSGDAIYEIESEKALQEVESIDEGILQILDDGPQQGDAIVVGALIGYLLEAGEPRVSPSVQHASHEPQEAPVESATTTTLDSTGDRPRITQTPSSTIRISPRAARVAAELGVDPSSIRGSGRDGRIRESDVRAAAKPSQEDSPEPVTDRLIEPSPLRQTIAERVTHSLRNTAPVTLTTQADAEHLVDLRNQFRNSETSTRPSYLDMLAKLTALALKRHPLLNSRWTETGILQPDGIHIGIAVDTSDGLLVPVIRNTDTSRLVDIAAQTSDLIDRARTRKCTADELTGSTFTITNLGAFGVDEFTPIINWPESAVLGMGAIRRVPVVLENDSIAPRHRISLSLTFDHQIADGAPAAQFLQALVAMVENPAPHLM